MFQDEARFGRVGLPRRCWAPKGMRPKCPAQIIREYIYAYSAVSPLDGAIESLIAPDADAKIMGIFLAQLSERFSSEHVVMFMDKAAWHTTGKLELPKNVTISFLPPYSPQLNPVEIIWREIRKGFFHNLVFNSIDAVEDRLFEALTYMLNNPETVKSISSFDWIVTSLKNAK